MANAQLLLSSPLSYGPPMHTNSQLSFAGNLIGHSIPYLILALNYAIFQLLRSFVRRLFGYYARETPRGGRNSKLRLLKLLADELISTCELCADCAELNVVYEKHGSLAYGLALFLLSYIWIEAFGDAYTTPGYLAEDYFLDKGNELLKTGDAYARFIGQSLAMPLAWRFATLYWKYHLLNEHSSMLIVENCHSSLSTSSWIGFMIEFSCCLICRLTELSGHRLLERKYLSQRTVSVACSFICSILVVLALELSGGYFNPILAASLEYGCKGIEWHQHALVFWLGPLSGHVLARALFKRYAGSEQTGAPKVHSMQASRATTSHTYSHNNSSCRQIDNVLNKRSGARSSPRKKSRSDKVD